MRGNPRQRVEEIAVGNNQRQAIRNVLLRLGVHARPQQAVEVLEKLGVEVSTSFVTMVRDQMQREQAAAARERAKRAPASKARKRPQLRKIPPGRR